MVDKETKHENKILEDKVIEENKALINQIEIRLMATKVQNEIDLHNLHILQQHLCHMTKSLECCNNRFKSISNSVNNNMMVMLKDLKINGFYEEDIHRINCIKTTWKDHNMNCACYWKDEEDLLHQAIDKERCWLIDQKEQIELTSANIQALRISSDNILIAPNDVIDVTGTNSAVIDLATSEVTIARENSTKRIPHSSIHPSPWYHEHKRRKANPFQGDHFPTQIDFGR